MSKEREKSKKYCMCKPPSACAPMFFGATCHYFKFFI